MSKLRVAVLMGGPSSEREVSLRSGQMVLKNLDPTQYEPFALDLSDLLGRPEAWVELKAKADFVFLALHGQLGEDGTVQGMLEVLGLPYYGSGVMASATAMNKVRSKAIYRELGIPQARGLDFIHLEGDLWQPGLSPLFPAERAPMTGAQMAAFVGETLGWDLVVKGASQGSTLGLALVKQQAEFLPAMESTRAYDRELLIEERIPGVEVTAGVIGGRDLTALPLVEIRPKKGELFDFEAKYTAGASEDLCPAPLDAALTSRIQELAMRAHRGLGCWGVSRSDFMIKDGVPYILETNTLPGITENSLVPMAARAVGVMLPDLLSQFIQWGLERKPAGNASTSARAAL